MLFRFNNVRDSWSLGGLVGEDGKVYWRMCDVGKAIGLPHINGGFCNYVRRRGGDVAPAAWFEDYRTKQRAQMKASRAKIATTDEVVALFRRRERYDLADSFVATLERGCVVRHVGYRYSAYFGRSLAVEVVTTTDGQMTTVEDWLVGFVCYVLKKRGVSRRPPPKTLEDISPPTAVLPFRRPQWVGGGFAFHPLDIEPPAGEDVFPSIVRDVLVDDRTDEHPAKRGEWRIMQTYGRAAIRAFVPFLLDSSSSRLHYRYRSDWTSADFRNMGIRSYSFRDLSKPIDWVLMRTRLFRAATKNRYKHHVNFAFGGGEEDIVHYYLVKAYFTFGTRTVAEGTVHVYRSYPPAKLLVFVRRSELLPEDFHYRLEAGTTYVVVARRRTFFTLQVAKEAAPYVKTEKGWLGSCLERRKRCADSQKKKKKRVYKKI